MKKIPQRKKKASGWRLYEKYFLNLNSLYNTHSLPCFASAFKLHNACGKRKERIITPDTDVEAGMKFCAPLPHENIAGKDDLTAKALHAEALGITIAAVSGTSAAFFMSHTTSPI